MALSETKIFINSRNFPQKCEILVQASSCIFNNRKYHLINRNSSKNMYKTISLTKFHFRKGKFLKMLCFVKNRNVSMKNKNCKQRNVPESQNFNMKT